MLTCPAEFDTVEGRIIPTQTPRYEDFHRRIFRFTVLVVLIGTLVAAVFGTRQVVQGFALGGLAAILHVRLLGRAVSRFGTRSSGLGAFWRIGLVAGIFFLAVKRTDLFVWWAALLGFLTERVAMGLEVGLPLIWPSDRGNTHG